MTRPADIYENAKDYFNHAKGTGYRWLFFPVALIGFLFDMTIIMAIVIILNLFGIEEL